MAKVDLANVGYVPSSAATINNNNVLIEQAVENTLSRDGTGPNEMNANLDMNNNRVYNLPEPISATEPMRKSDVDDLISAASLGFVATQSEAEAGVNNTKTMTPLRTKQAITKFAPGLAPSVISIPTDFPTLSEALQSLSNLRIQTKLTILIEEGTHPQNLFTVINHPDAINIEILGVFVPVTISSVASATGSAWAHSSVVTLVSTSGVSVGDYLVVDPNTISASAPDEADFEGCFRITSKIGNTITVLLPHGSSSFPTISSTNFSARVVKSVLKWDSVSQSGIGVYGTTVGLVSNIVFDGSFDVAIGVGSDVNSGAGLVLAGWGHPTAGESGIQSGGSYGTFNYCGFVRWKYNGVLVHACSVNLDHSHFCGNGWRGVQAAGNAVVFAKFSSAHGNRKTGFAQEHGGALNVSRAVACGNAEAGVYNIGGGTHNGPNMRLHRNGANGFDFRYAGYGEFGDSHIRGNTGYAGIVTGQNVTVRVNGTTTVNNTSGGFRSESNALVQAQTTAPTISEVTKYSSSVAYPGFFMIAGINGPISGKLDLTSLSGSNGGFTITPISSGGMVFSSRADATAAAVSLLTLNSAGALYPSTGTQEIGRSNNPWNRAYSNALVIADGITQPAAITGMASIYVDTADGDLKIRFSDGTIKLIVTDT